MPLDFIEHGKRLVFRPQLKELVPYSDATIWRIEHLPPDNPRKFPDRIRLSRNRVAWQLGDVLAWIERQKDTSDPGPKAA